MVKTTLKQKTFLIFLSFFLTLVLLELALRLGGFIFTSHQNWINRIALEESEIRILCIGESTTALGGEDSYPSQLENILNKRRPDKKFKVINKGFVSSTSREILAQLEDNMDKYKPDIVVSMIGINEEGRHVIEVNTFPIKVRAFLEKFRVYKLGQLMGAHITYKIKEVKLKNKADREDPEQLLKMDVEEVLVIEEKGDVSQRQALMQQLAITQQMSSRLEKHLRGELPKDKRKESEKGLKDLKRRRNLILIRLGLYHRVNKEFGEAQKYLAIALKESPEDSEAYGAYLEMGRTFKDQKQCEKAIPLFNKAADIYPKGVLAYMELGRCFAALDRPERAFRFFERVLSKKTKDLWIYSEIGDWFQENKYYRQAAQSYIKAIELIPVNYFLYEKLAKVYEAQGLTEKAKMYYERARQGSRQVHQYSPFTVDNYNKIIDMVRLWGAQPVCMQYPLRSVEPLTEIFWSDKKIIFVENKKNFEQALAKGEFTDYFTDHFAPEFGHCTRAGNRLIAESLAETILTRILTE